MSGGVIRTESAFAFGRGNSELHLSGGRIEVGVQIRSESIAIRITRHFDAMADEGLVQPLPFPSDRTY